MKYDIVPGKAIKGIPFGTGVSGVRAALGAGFRSFKRTPDAVHPCDYFAAAGLFANYDKTGRLEVIELASPAAPELYGINLLGMGFEQAVKYLKSKDPRLEREVDGAISLAPGISLYAPHAAKDPKAPAESVLVFAPGYYD